MKLPNVPRPLFAALCGLSLVALPSASPAQERDREERPRENGPRDERPRGERPAEGQRPPRGEFRPGDNPRGEPPRGEVREGAPRREEAGRGEGRPVEGQRGDFRPPEGQRGQPAGQFNPQELFRDLNDDQRQALRGFFEAQQGAMREVGERSTRLRREITEATLADKVNEGLIRDKIMESAKLEAEAAIVRARAFAQVRNRLPKETVERLRGMIASQGPRPGMQGPPPGGQMGNREGGDGRRPAGDNFNQPGRGVPDGQGRRPDAPRDGDQFRKPAGEGDRRAPEGEFRRPAAPREGEQIRKPAESDRGPRPDGDRGVRPEGDRGRNPEGGERKPEAPRRPPVEQ